MRNYTDGSDRYMPYDNTYGQSNNVYASQDRYPETKGRSGRNKSGKKVKTRKGSDTSIKSFFSSGSVDSYLFLLIIFLTAIGLVMILSSSYYTAIERRGTGYYYFYRQFIWSLIGIVAMLVVSKINYNVIKKIAFPAYIGSLALLFLVFIIGIGTKGATRWLEIGSINFQPSEIAKIGLIAALALLLSKRKDYSEYLLPKGAANFWYRLWNRNVTIYLKEWILIFLPVALIISENLSTGIVVFATGVIMLSISGFRIEKWSILAIVFIIGIIFAAKTGGIARFRELNFADGKYNRRLQRIETWIDPFEDPLDTGFQTVQSLYAIGSGGITGVGLGKSKQKLGYLPESHNDMIFTIVCEEFGLIGAVVLLGLFMALIIKCCQIALKAPDRFAMYFTMGMITLIALQVIINVGVVTGAIPNTGMPLPFISYGGTSLVFTMVGMGVILNISRYVK